jgi:hypothetical protein
VPETTMMRIENADKPRISPSDDRAAAVTPNPAARELHFVHHRPGRDELALAALGLDGAIERLGIEDLIARLENSTR